MANHTKKMADYFGMDNLSVLFITGDLQPILTSRYDSTRMSVIVIWFFSY
jgi:hypothetical protein